MVTLRHTVVAKLWVFLSLFVKMQKKVSLNFGPFFNIMSLERNICFKEELFDILQKGGMKDHNLVNMSKSDIQKYFHTSISSNCLFAQKLDPKDLEFNIKGENETEKNNIFFLNCINMNIQIH